MAITSKIGKSLRIDAFVRVCVKIDLDKLQRGWGLDRSSKISFFFSNMLIGKHLNLMCFLRICLRHLAASCHNS